MKVALSTVIAVIFSGYFSSANASNEIDNSVIHIGKLNAAPTVDGSDADWQNVPAVKIPLAYLDKPDDIRTVTLKTGVFGDQVYFYSEWDDAAADTLHKPNSWDETQQKYVEGPQREDRFALEFAMKGDYDANWFSGKEFTADMWNWKAARTNPIGIAHDKTTIISKQAMPESYKTTLPDSSILYIQRPTDLGGDPYETKRYFQKQQDIMPKYVPLEKLPDGVDDVKAKGVWKDGKWHLELSRKLNTHHADDVLFANGKKILGAIAVFDHDDSEHHYTSKTLTFDFDF